ncbi:MAG: hypothetical protein WAT81_02855 [Candidatus Moraniibacteriota bacterium]
MLLDRLVYAQKDYSAKPPEVFSNNRFFDGVSQELRVVATERIPVFYTCGSGPIPLPDEECTPVIDGPYYRRDQVRGLLSVTLSSSAPGFGWYGTGGLWNWSTLTTLRPESEAACTIPAHCRSYTSKDFTLEQRTVVYASGGLQYRFEFGRASLTPFIGVVGHWPRIESVSGTNHLFQLGLRGGLKLSEQSELLLQYSHFSNGNRLKLADETLSNQGIEAVSFGLGWKF